MCACPFFLVQVVLCMDAVLAAYLFLMTFWEVCKYSAT